MHDSTYSSIFPTRFNVT